MPERHAVLSSPPLTWTIGDVTITRVEESIIPLTAKVLVPDATPAHVAAGAGWIEPYIEAPDDGDGHPVLRLSIHSFVVRTPDTVIVVDTCVGPDPDRGLPGDPAFVERLDDAIVGGLAAVDVVVCTHVHFDHVGWNTRVVDGRVVPTFPNARYLVTRAELEEVEADDHMDVRVPSLLPLAEAGVLHAIELDEAPDGGDGVFRIDDHVELLSTPGHTAGHVSVRIHDGGAEALITGDAFHSPLQILDPTLAAWRFDTDSEQSTATRRRLLDRYCGTDAIVLGTHFAPPTAGHMVDGGHGTTRFEGIDGP
ncbi:MAG: MBL fold metallo-hydrolase [Actinomycetota bacterium]